MNPLAGVHDNLLYKLKVVIHLLALELEGRGHEM